MFSTREREIQALIEAAPHHPAATLHLIALDIPAAIDITPGIALHNAADWMLVKDE